MRRKDASRHERLPAYLSMTSTSEVCLIPFPISLSRSRRPTPRLSSSRRRSLPSPSGSLPSRLDFLRPCNLSSPLSGRDAFAANDRFYGAVIAYRRHELGGKCRPGTPSWHALLEPSLLGCVCGDAVNGMHCALELLPDGLRLERVIGEQRSLSGTSRQGQPRASPHAAQHAPTTGRPCTPGVVVERRSCPGKPPTRRGSGRDGRPHCCR